MKKFFFFVGLILMSFGALQAQRDTVGYNVPVPWYFKNFPIENMHDSIHNGTSCTPNTWKLAFGGENSFYSYVSYTSYYNGDIAFGFYSDTIIHVIGIAWINDSYILDNYNDDESSETEAIINHTHPLYDSIFCRLYIPNGNQMQLVREKGLDEIDKNNCRFWNITKDLPAGDLQFLHLESGNHLKQIVEIFFDNEIDLSDSFYISTKYRCVDYNGMYTDRSIGYFEYHSPEVDTFFYPPLSYRRLPDSANADDPWQYGIKRTYPLLFPIIRRDCDTCPHVQGIEVVPVGNGQAFLRWQRGTNHVDWQVSYGPAGTAPDDGTIIEFTNPISNIISFNPDSHYVAYVRARCRFARYEWGPWSDPVSIHLGGSGIDEAALAGMVMLSPNPATDEVSIDSPVPMTLVEAYDEKGACILRQELNTQHSSLNTKTWSSGAYILRIHTQQGVATKRLTVMH